MSKVGSLRLLTPNPLLRGVTLSTALLNPCTGPTTVRISTIVRIGRPNRLTTRRGDGRMGRRLMHSVGLEVVEMSPSILLPTLVRPLLRTNGKIPQARPVTNGKNPQARPVINGTSPDPHRPVTNGKTLNQLKVETTGKEIGRLPLLRDDGVKADTVLLLPPQARPPGMSTLPTRLRVSKLATWLEIRLEVRLEVRLAVL